MRRNPAALCRALLLHERTQLAELLRQVRLGCEWALRDPESPDARWVTHGLVDSIFGAVAARQGVAPSDVSASRGLPGDNGAQAELVRCVESVDRYLNLGCAVHKASPHAPYLAPYLGREPNWDAPRAMGTDELFLQLLETAIH